MKRNKQFILSSIIIFLATVTCQTSGNPISTPMAEPIQTAITLPTVQPTSTVSAENNIHAIFPSLSLTDPNTICIAHTSEALSCLDATGWHIYKNGYDESSNPISTIPAGMIRCPDGRIYLNGGGIFQLEGEMLVELGGGGFSDTVVCGSENEIWASSMGGVSHFDGSTWTQYSVEKIFQGNSVAGSDYIHSMSVAPNGNVWVTTGNSIATFDGSDWKSLLPPGNPAGYSDSSMRGGEGLVIDSSGTVWAPTNRELLKYDGIQWTVFPFIKSISNNWENPTIYINYIAADRENRIWAATDQGEIYTLDQQSGNWDLQFDIQQLGLGKPHYPLYDIQFDGRNRLWLATNYGVGIYDGLTWTTYHLYTANIYTNDITALFILGDGPDNLPALEVKPPGSVLGKLVSRSSSPFIDAQVELCLMPGEEQWISEETPCANQAYHALSDVNTDGSFVILNVPVGSYNLMIKISDKWGSMVDVYSPLSLYLDHEVEFSVSSGKETQLGEISTP